MLIEFLRKNKNRILLLLLALWQAADLVAVHLLINRTFISGSRNILAVINSPYIQYNTEAYFTGLSMVIILMSALVGGFLVFGVTKLVEMIAMELGILESKIPVGFVPAAFFAVCLPIFMIIWISGGNLYSWGCPLLAYFTGVIIWAATVKWKIEFEKGLKL